LRPEKLNSVKQSIMKTNAQQEILLVTSSTLSKRLFCRKDSALNMNYSEAEQLEEACWNGLLGEMLPEIIHKSASGKTLSLWQIHYGYSFLDIELSESPRSFKKDFFSINPYCFLEVMCNN